MNFHMSAQTLGEFVRVRQLVSAKLGIELDLNSDGFLTELFHTCGESGSESLHEAADRLWSCLTADNPEMSKRKELNQLHQRLRSEAN